MKGEIPPPGTAEPVSQRWEEFYVRWPLVRFSVQARVIRASWLDPALGGIPQLVDGKDLYILVNALERLEGHGYTFGQEQVTVRELVTPDNARLARLTARQTRHAMALLMRVAEETSGN